MPFPDWRRWCGADLPVFFQATGLSVPGHHLLGFVRSAWTARFECLAGQHAVAYSVRARGGTVIAVGLYT